MEKVVIRCGKCNRLFPAFGHKAVALTLGEALGMAVSIEASCLRCGHKITFSTGCPMTDALLALEGQAPSDVMTFIDDNAISKEDNSCQG
jgi:hypothetical protein